MGLGASGRLPRCLLGVRGGPQGAFLEADCKPKIILNATFSRAPPPEFEHPAPGTPEAQMEPQRPSNEPQEASGVRESTGKQLGAPRRNGKRPASARSARARASRENSLNLPPGPPDQGKLEKFAAKPPDYGKRERFTAEPPDYGKRERFTAGPPDHEKTRELYRGTTRQTQHTTGHTVASTAF